jgi:DNA-binding transcriptional ArsR family regulator
MTADPAIDWMLAALLDPTRRAAIDLLRKNPCRAGELVDALRRKRARAEPPSAYPARGAGLITDDDVVAVDPAEAVKSSPSISICGGGADRAFAMPGAIVGSSVSNPASAAAYSSHSTPTQ